ncbi:MAG: hypothetical protein K2X66_10560 [Cyanobacteria bacterium]|nr:hypothetical protein [Cyanobacteriota bacterium]
MTSDLNVYTAQPRKCLAFGAVEHVWSERNATAIKAQFRLSDTEDSQDFTTFSALKGRVMARNKKTIQLTYNLMNDWIGYNRSDYVDTPESPHSILEYQQLIQAFHKMPFVDESSRIIKKIMSDKLKMNFRAFCEDKLRYVGRCLGPAQDKVAELLKEKELYTQALSSIDDLTAEKTDIEYYI